MQYKVDKITDEDDTRTTLFVILKRKHRLLPYSFLKNENGIMTFYTRSEAESKVLLLENIKKVKVIKGEMLLIFILSILVSVITILMMLWNM